MKIILSHPTGNEFVRHALSGLYKEHILSEFYTSIATFPNNNWGKLSRLSPFSELSRRNFLQVLEEFTFTYPYKELGRLLCTKLNIYNLIKQETGFFSVDKVYEYLDIIVANKLRDKSINAIYAYEDGALNSFKAAKQKGINCLYDLPIGYWLAAREMMTEERLKRPEWANTLGGFRDSDFKLVKKDKELALADHIFVASSFTKKTLAYYPDKLCPISVIPYGFPDVYKEREYTSIVNRPLKVLFVGGLSQRKGIANVLEVVEILKQEVELTIVGNKSTQDCVPLNKGLKKHRWIPTLPHSQVLEQMRSHDVLLFPSLFEGFGLVISEAMSQGTPVITTDRTAGADFIEHRKNGWLVNPGDTNDLVNTISSILNQPDKLIGISKAAMNTANDRPWANYSSDLVADIIRLNK